MFTWGLKSVHFQVNAEIEILEIQIQIKRLTNEEFLKIYFNLAYLNKRKNVVKNNNLWNEICFRNTHQIIDVNQIGEDQFSAPWDAVDGRQHLAGDNLASVFDEADKVMDILMNAFTRRNHPDKFRF